MNRYRADGDLAFDPAARRYRFRGARAAPAAIHFNGEKRDVEPFFRALGGQAEGEGAGEGGGKAARTRRVFWGQFEFERVGALHYWLAAAALAALSHGAAAARSAGEGEGEEGGEEGGAVGGEVLGG